MGVINSEGDYIPDHPHYSADTDSDHKINCVKETKSDFMNAHLETMEKFTDPKKAKYQMLFEDKYYIIHKDDFQKIFKRLLSNI